MLHASLLTPRILKWLLDLRKHLCTPGLYVYTAWNVTGTHQQQVAPCRRGTAVKSKAAVDATFFHSCTNVHGLGAGRRNLQTELGDAQTFITTIVKQDHMPHCDTMHPYKQIRLEFTSSDACFPFFIPDCGKFAVITNHATDHVSGTWQLQSNSKCVINLKQRGMNVGSRGLFFVTPR